MICTHCGAENSVSATFCSECGKTFSTETEKNDDSFEDSKIFIALILSFFFVGLGISYAGNLKKGLIYFAIGTTLNFICRYFDTSLGVIVIIFWAFALHATYKEAIGEPVSIIIDKYL